MNNKTVWVAALGYFVDIYDLILFSIVRVPSLQSLGLTQDEVFHQGIFLLNMQMFGMLLGGIFWGILGDKKGRLSVLFGSIALYSIANIANGFVNSVEAYAVFRLIAGFGLAGELGAGITLVTEVLPKHLRGYGTTFVATLGVSGAVAAGLTGELTDWRTAYIVGGSMGLALLVLRLGLAESQLFVQVKHADHKRGNFLSIFTHKHALMKYIRCFLIGMPIWYVTGILITFSPEFAKHLNIEMADSIKVSKVIFIFYIGGVLGDLASGLLSQKLKSRKRTLAAFILQLLVYAIAFLTIKDDTLEVFYAVCFFMGFASGYWAVFVTVAAEQFGTNLRATVTTTLPNFVRGSVVPVASLFAYGKGHIGIVESAAVIGAVVFALSLYSMDKINETFHQDMDFIE